MVVPSPNTASISSSGTPIVSGYTFAGCQVRDLHRMGLVLTEVNDNETTNAEETMHRVQSPFDDLLKRRGDKSDDEIEEPVRCRG